MPEEKIIKSSEKRVLKRITKLMDSQEPKIQGEGLMRISPFDDYIMLTINGDVEGSATPLDLTGMGVLYLSFFDESQEIKIKQYDNIESLEPTRGQVVFRISKEDSKRILSLGNDKFYVSSRMNEGEESSDESVLYMGKFISFEEFPKKTLSEKLRALELSSNKEIAALRESNKVIAEEKKQQQAQIESLKLLLQQEQTQNSSLINQLDSLVSEVSKAKADEVKQAVEANVSNIKASQVKLQDKKRDNKKKSIKELEQTSAIINEKTSKPVNRSNFTQSSRLKTNKGYTSGDDVPEYDND